MTQPFTASEVRDEADFGGDLRLRHKMLYAYADRLESDEKAVPVYQVAGLQTGSDWSDCDEETFHAARKWPGDQRRRILYTHPAPADAARLAEALEIVDGWMELYDHQGTGSSRDASRSEKEWAADRAKLVALLTTHSTQAQPPTADAPAETCERPPECANGCPEFQVCDYCQRPHRTGADAVRLTEALRVIRQHLAGDPSATAASIISTIDTALADRPSEPRPPVAADEYVVVKADPDIDDLDAVEEFVQSHIKWPT